MRQRGITMDWVSLKPELTRLCKKGMPTSELAARYGVSQGYMRKMLDIHGIRTLDACFRGSERHREGQEARDFMASRKVNYAHY